MLPVGTDVAAGTTSVRPAVPWSPNDTERSLLFDIGRLTVLHEAALLDVPAPDDLQRLTKLLARQLHTPIATLTVIDADRQYFLASTGLPETLAASRQTALPGAFCKHVLFDDAPLVVHDVANPPAYADYDAVELTGMGCYLGAPIKTADGTRVGALCVMAPEAREWQDDDVATVQDFASLAADLIDARLIRARSMHERNEKLDILTRITEGFVTFDREWRVTFVNAKAAALARCTPAEAEGRTLWDLLPPLDGSETGAWLRRSATLRGSTSANGRGWRIRVGSSCAWSSRAKECRCTSVTSRAASARRTRWPRVRPAIAS